MPLLPGAPENLFPLLLRFLDGVRSPPTERKLLLGFRFFPGDPTTHQIQRTLEDRSAVPAARQQQNYSRRIEQLWKQKSW